MQTKLIVDPISTCNSPEPRINASGTTTCRLTKCDITPVDVETYRTEQQNGIRECGLRKHKRHEIK